MRAEESPAVLELGGRTGSGISIIDRLDALDRPHPETIYSDLKFIRCPLVNASPPVLFSHRANGAEIFYHDLAYALGSTTLNLGVRTEGAIGDFDGDADPDRSGSGGKL